LSGTVTVSIAQILLLYQVLSSYNRSNFGFPNPGRIENRALDRASSAGSLYELPERKLSSRGNHLLPMSLREAHGHLVKDAVLQQVLGTEFTSYYLQVKTEEWRQRQRSVRE
jgi:glutamine synthetase